jgi:hypothetical protein
MTYNSSFSCPLLLFNPNFFSLSSSTIGGGIKVKFWTEITPLNCLFFSFYSNKCFQSIFSFFFCGFVILMWCCVVRCFSVGCFVFTSWCNVCSIHIRFNSMHINQLFVSPHLEYWPSPSSFLLFFPSLFNIFES